MPSDVYRDFEIHIRKPSADGLYPVGVWVADEDRRADGVWQSPFSDEEVNRALIWMEQGLFDADYVKQFGTGLFHSLIADQIKEVYEGSRTSGGSALRIRLIVDAPAAARIPWELLYDPAAEIFLAIAGPFVRGLSLTVPTHPLTVKPPLRILVVDAFPQGVLKVQDQIETRGIQHALADLIRERRVEVVTLPKVTLAKLQNVLREAANPERPRPFHLLHFIGHGQYDNVSGRTVLLFEDDQGQVDEVEAETLVNVLRSFDLKLVFLNACQSVQSSALDITRGLAPALLTSGVPAVIGMQVTVLDPVAIKFACDFYSALADNRPVDAALTDARQLARGTRLRRKADLGIPVCYLRTATGQILELQPADQVPLTLQTWRPWLRQRATPRYVVRAILSLITLVSAVLGLYWGVVPFLARPPRMTGQFNIAVAEFASLDAQNHVARSPAAHDLAESVFTAIDDEVKSLKASGALQGFNIQVRGPDTTGSIKGTTGTARAQSAVELASTYNMDVIVYGNLAHDTDATSLRPEFYLSSRTLQNAEELVGQYQYGSNVEALGDVTRNPVLAKGLSESLEARTRALTQFVIGLGYYTIDQFDKAATYFQAADKTPHWDERDGKDVLYLFMGNTAGQLHDLTSAQAYYDHALRIDPEYARARLGAAEVLFQRSHKDCEKGSIDVAGLQAAIRGYQSALTAREQPAQSDIQAKTAFALGRTYVCLSQALVEPRWKEAETEFRKVIDDYEHGNQRIKERAAEAHANLAVVYLPSQDEPGAAAKYQRAAGEYRKAIETTRRAVLQAECYRMLGHIYGRLKDYSQADSAYAEAIRLDPDHRDKYEQLRQQLQRERTGS